MADKPTYEELEQKVKELERVVHENRHTEKKLFEISELNQKVVDSSCIGIVAYRADTGQCVMANEVAAKAVSGTVEQLLQKNFRQLKPWKATGLLEAAEDTLTTGQDKQIDANLYITSFGKKLWAECDITTFMSNDLPHLLVMFNDITERKQAEEALRKSENQLRMITDNIPANVSY